MDIRDSILEKQAEKRANIIKAFIPEDELEKAVYADNVLNQKLQRVGKEWGGKKQDDKGDEKTPKGKPEDAEAKAPIAHEDIQKHLSATSTETLQKFASDKTNDAKLVEHAKRELEVRAQAEIGDDSKSDSNKKDGGESNYDIKEMYAKHSKKTGGTSIDIINSIMEETGETFDEISDKGIGAGLFESSDVDSYEEDKNSTPKEVFDNESSGDIKYTFEVEDDYLNDKISKTTMKKRIKAEFPNSKSYISAFIKQHNSKEGLRDIDGGSPLSSDDAISQLEMVVLDIYNEDIDGSKYIKEDEEEEETDSPKVEIEKTYKKINQNIERMSDIIMSGKPDLKKFKEEFESFSKLIKKDFPNMDINRKLAISIYSKIDSKDKDKDKKMDTYEKHMDSIFKKVKMN